MWFFLISYVCLLFCWYYWFDLMLSHALDTMYYVGFIRCQTDGSTIPCRSLFRWWRRRRRAKTLLLLLHYNHSFELLIWWKWKWGRKTPADAENNQNDTMNKKILSWLKPICLGDPNFLVFVLFFLVELSIHTYKVCMNLDRWSVGRSLWYRSRATSNCALMAFISLFPFNIYLCFFLSPHCISKWRSCWWRSIGDVAVASTGHCPLWLRSLASLFPDKISAASALK